MSGRAIIDLTDSKTSGRMESALERYLRCREEVLAKSMRERLTANAASWGWVPVQQPQEVKTPARVQRQRKKQKKEPVPPVPPPCNDIPQDCIICMETKRQVAAAPCGHMVLCEACSVKLVHQPCSICRVKVTKFNRVYLS